MPMLARAISALRPHEFIGIVPHRQKGRHCRLGHRAQAPEYCAGGAALLCILVQQARNKVGHDLPGRRQIDRFQRRGSGGVRVLTAIPRGLGPAIEELPPARRARPVQAVPPATMRVDGSSSWSISIHVGTARAPVESQYHRPSRPRKRTSPSRCSVISRGVRTVGDEALPVMRTANIVKCKVPRSAYHNGG
jgi:hypothetical protein